MTAETRPLVPLMACLPSLLAFTDTVPPKWDVSRRRVQSWNKACPQDYEG